MDEYFLKTLNRLRSEDYSSLTIVLGNESCDLDSAVSSLVYALFLHWQYNQIKCKVCTRNNRVEATYKDDNFVSILNVDREDFNLKTEVVYLFTQNGIRENQLIFRDDLDLQEIVTKKSPKVVLVDHHALAPRDQFLAPFVSEIIDHRPIDNSCWNYKADTRSTIEIVGSCTTLVAQRIKDLSALVAKDVDFFNAFPFTCSMLHSTIILDTINFSKEFNKARPHDEEIVLFLETLIKPDNYESHRRNELDRLVQAKADVSALTASQLLRKDTKTSGDILVVTFPTLVQEFLLKQNVQDALTEVLAKTNCNMAVMLGIDLKSGLKRDAAIYASETARADQLATFLENWSDPPLQLTPQEAPPPVNRYYKQLNLSATRKQYMPALNQFMNKK